MGGVDQINAILRFLQLRFERGIVYRIVKMKKKP